MLDTLPTEVLTVIGLHLSLSTLLPPVDLLCTCRSIYDALGPKTNPRLYARVFRANFDIEAVERRIGPQTASDITRELTLRARSMYALRAMVTNHNVEEVEEEHLWPIFFMLLENDGKNLSQLERDDLLDLHAFIDLYRHQVLIADACDSEFPKQTIGKALVIWIMWLLHTHDDNSNESTRERYERRFMLRPWVFAAHRSDAFYAPWTIDNLPQTQPVDSPQRDPLDLADVSSYLANLTPRVNTVKVHHFGREIDILPPNIFTAAAQLFFAKSSKVRLTWQSPDSPPPLDHFPELLPLFMQEIAMEEEDDIEDQEVTIGNLLASSTLHDRDLLRLQSCHDAFTSRGMRPSDWRGSFEGCWEGSFSFFDFEAYRLMLTGDHRALYGGPFGEQRQVWRLRETFLRPKRDSQNGEDRKGKGRAVPFWTYKRQLALASTPSSTHNEASALDRTIQEQVDTYIGYEVIPADELDAALAENDGRGSSGMEIAISGVGHSAWGRFVLKGRLRIWDGLLTALKIYSPDYRGKWLYRGYVNCGNVMVGRWRDTLTSEAYIGYEGTFILNRR